jgi:response regulator of citrate/malate metabolism
VIFRNHPIFGSDFPVWFRVVSSDVHRGWGEFPAMAEINRKNVLIVEVDRDVSELFARALEVRRDCKCYLAASEEEAADLMRDIPFDLVLVDFGIAMDGDFRFLKRIGRMFPEIIVVIDAYLHQKEHLSRALVLGAKDYLFKPIKLDSFRKKIEQFFLSPATAVRAEGPLGHEL